MRLARFWFLLIGSRCESVRGNALDDHFFSARKRRRRRFCCRPHSRSSEASCWENESLPRTQCSRQAVGTATVVLEDVPVWYSQMRGGLQRVFLLPGNGAVSKVANLFRFMWRCFCGADRSKAAFPEAFSPEPEGEAQSNSALRQYSTKQYQHQITSKRGRAIFVLSSSLSAPPLRVPTLAGRNERT